MAKNNHPQTVINWTPAKEKRLAEMWPTCSATQIAQAIFSRAERAVLTKNGRNAVIGKAHRMGLEKPATPARPRSMA